MVIKIYICELIKPKTRPGAYLQCLKTHASEQLFYTPLRFVKKVFKVYVTDRSGVQSMCLKH